VTLQYLKQALSAHGLDRGLRTTDRSCIGIDPEIIVSDIDLFLKAGLPDEPASSEAREVAALLMSGTFFAGLHDAWVDPARAELIAQKADFLCRMASESLDADPRQALVYASAVTKDDPNDREANRLVAAAHERLKGSPGDVPARPGTSTGLPRQRTSFYGREAEMRAILDWAGQDRYPLMTVFGPGGIGKSRLGSEAIARLDPNAKTRVIWVDAVNARTQDALLELIASESSDGEAIQGDPLRHIVATLHGKPSLIVLDNLEQIPDEALQIVDEISSRLPLAQILCLSRKALGITGERTLGLTPLPLPSGPDDVRSPAIELFLDRSGLRKDGPIDPDLFNLVTALEGIPLAIELAAAKTLSLSVRELLAGMSARLDLLVARNPKLARHRTLRSTLDWSFDLLPPQLRDSIVDLAVLKNGWTVEAANALLGKDVEGLSETREIVEAAHANSLVYRTVQDSKSRYHMLEFTREYALEAIPPSRLRALRNVHAEHYLAVARAGAGVRSLESDQANLEAALEYLTESPERFDRLIGMGRALVRFWTQTSAGRPALRILQSIDFEALRPDQKGPVALLKANIQLSISDFEGCVKSGLSAIDPVRPEGDPEVRGPLLATISRAYTVLGKPAESEAAAREAVRITEKASAAARAEALLALGKRELAYVEPQTVETIERALAAARESGDVFLQSEALDAMGCALFRHREFDRADEVFTAFENLSLDLVPLRSAHINIRRAQVAICKSDLQQGRTLYEAALSHARTANHPWWICQTAAQLGDTYNKLGLFREAREVHTEALNLRKVTGELQGLASCLRGLGNASYGLGEFQRALEELTGAKSIAERTQDDFLLATIILPFAKAAIAVGRTSVAQDALMQAIGLFTSLLEDTRLTNELDLEGARLEAESLLDGLH
jgi:predicted ATPase